MRNIICFWALLAVGAGHAQAIVNGEVRNRFGPLVGARVDIQSTTFGMLTGPSGEFAFDLDSGFYMLQVSYPGYRKEERLVRLDYLNERTELFELEESALNAEVSVGSRSGQQMNQFNSPVPIDLITRDELLSTGRSELGQALHVILPNFFSVRQDLRDGTSFVDAIAYRGLSPDQVLILVNGKRRLKSAVLNVGEVFGRGSAGSDINMIPISAVERIEVLRDGASSQYGSDALAGVINIILSKDTGLATLSLSGGTTTEGDGTETQLDLSYGLGLGENGFLNLTAGFLDREAVNRTGAYGGIVYGDSLDLIPSSRDIFFDQTGFEDGRVASIGSPGLTKATLLLNGQLDLATGVRFYAHGNFGFRSTEDYGQYRFPYQVELVGFSRFGFAPELVSSHVDQSLVLGLRKTIDDWTLDLGVQRADNQVGIDVRNSINVSMGIASPTSADAGGYRSGHTILTLDGTRAYTGLSSNWQLSVGTEFRIEDYEIMEGELESYLDQGDTVRNGIPGAPGIQGYFGIRPEDALTESRYNAAAYAELDFDFQQVAFLEVAARYESFSDFGENFSYKLAGSIKPWQNLALRASYSTGFKAPSLQQLYYNRLSPSIREGEAVNIIHANSESNTVGIFGLNRLQPEISENLSGGMSFTFNKGFSITADVFQIDIDDRIALSRDIDVGISRNLEQALGDVDVDGVQFFSNSLNTRTRGVDVVARYNQELGLSVVRLSFAYSMNETTVEEIIFQLPAEAIDFIPDSINVDGFQGFDVLDRVDQSIFTTYIPSQQVRNQLTFDHRLFSLSLAHNGFGEVTYLHPGDEDPENWEVNELSGVRETRDQTFAWRNTFDVSLSIKPSKGIRWTLGGNNVLNTLPERIDHSALTRNGVDRYSSQVQQMDLVGTYLYSTLIIRF